MLVCCLFKLYLFSLLTITCNRSICNGFYIATFILINRCLLLFPIVVCVTLSPAFPSISYIPRYLLLHITNVTSLRLQIAMTIKDKENADPNVLQADVDSKKSEHII